MNRRNFINTLAATTAGLAFFSQSAQAQLAPPVPTDPATELKPVKINLEILTNHGHNGAVSYESVIIGNTVTLDIQGTSHHPHTLILNEDDLTQLRQKLVVDVKSSVDAGHSHMVRITRDPITT